jgi:putative thioredoxin
MSSVPNITDVTDATFQTEVIDASRQRPVVVDFWAAWCGPCRVLGPTIEEVVGQHPEVTLAKLDVDANPRTSSQYGIRSIPAVKAFRDGRVVDEFVGLQPRPNVERFIAGLVPAPALTLPDDEEGLRRHLDTHPDSVDAVRALGRRLIGAGRFDEADEVLAKAPQDPVSDGLRARLEVQRGGDGLLPASLYQRDPAREINAMPDLIAAIRTADPAARALLRRVVLGVLAEQPPNDPAVQTLRGQLANALF